MLCSFAPPESVQTNKDGSTPPVTPWTSDEPDLSHWYQQIPSACSAYRDGSQKEVLPVEGQRWDELQTVRAVARANPTPASRGLQTALDPPQHILPTVSSILYIKIQVLIHQTWIHVVCCGTSQVFGANLQTSIFFAKIISKRHVFLFSLNVPLTTWQLYNIT